MGVCVCIRAHTHCTWGTKCEPRGRDETSGGPEESGWTEAWYICICICVGSTHMYINAGRQDEMLD